MILGCIWVTCGLQRSTRRLAISRRRSRNAAAPSTPTPMMPRCISIWGYTLGKSGDFAGAEEAIQVTTERIPRHVEAWYWLGVAREQQGKREAARAAYQRVVELAPSRLAARADAARAKVAALQ